MTKTYSALTAFASYGKRSLLALLLGAMTAFLAHGNADAQEVRAGVMPDIVGAWSRGDTTLEDSSVIVFLANGYYVDIEHARDVEGAAGFSGVEFGTYTWDAATGALRVSVLQDRNGELGLAPMSALAEVTLSLSGDTGALSAPGFRSQVLNRVNGGDPVVGAWGAAGRDVFYVFVLLANGTYFEGYGRGSSGGGLEHGTYTWNPALGTLTASRLYRSPRDYDGLSYYAPFQVFAQSETLGLEGCCFPFGYFSRIGAAPTNYQGMWVAADPAESGWGINFTHQGDVIFASWFTYDQRGAPRWVTATLTKTGYHTYSGSLDATRGPPFSSGSFDPAQVAHSTVGSATMTFEDGTRGSLSYSMNGVAQTKALARFEFAYPVPACSYGTASAESETLANNYQDMWVAADAAEPGWGINLTHQGDAIFASWFTYDATGYPTWLTATLNKTAYRIYGGSLDATTGPSFDSVPFDPARVTHRTAGDATLTFADGMRGTFSYSVDGVAGTKALERFVFRGRSTICQ